MSKEKEQIKHATKMIELMDSKGVKIEFLSSYIHFTGQEIYEIYVYLSYNESLVNEAINFLESVSTKEVERIQNLYYK